MTRRLIGLSLGDAPDAWSALGFAVEGGVVGLGALAVRCRGDAGPPSLVFDRALPDGGSFCGVAWEVAGTADPTSGTVGPIEHPNGVAIIDHVVITGPDAGAFRADLASAGLEIRRERAATIGDREMVQLFAFAGDVLLELVGGDGPAELWGLAVVAPDLDATAAALGDRCGTPTEAVQPGRRIATIRTDDAGISVRLAVMSPRI